MPTPVILDEVASGFASGFASASSFCDSWNVSASFVLLVTKQNETTTVTTIKLHRLKIIRTVDQM